MATKRDKVKRAFTRHLQMSSHAEYNIPSLQVGEVKPILDFRMANGARFRRYPPVHQEEDEKC